MRILHLIDESWDSGLVAYALQIAELLQKSGQEVVVGVLPGGKPEGMARFRGIPSVPIKSFGDLRRIMKSTSWDIVNAHTGRMHTWSLLSKISLGSQARSMALVRTRGDARELQVNPLFRYLYNQTAIVIAASDHVHRQYAERLGLTEEKARTIYPGIAIDETIVDYPSSTTVGILGRLDVVKGHTIFLEAAALVLKEKPSVKFRIAGKEAGVSLQLLQNQVAELQLEESVEFLGYVPSGPDFMRTCTFGVIASIGSEEVSRACLEWMGTGRAVIGTLVGCLPELIEPEESGLLVPPNDPSLLSESILRLLRHPELAIRWGEIGRRMAQTFYSPEIMLTKTLAAYDWAVKNNPTRR